MTVTRRGVLGGIAAGLASPALGAGPENGVRPRRRGDGAAAAAPVRAAGEIVARAALGGTLGYAVADAATGRMLEARDADRAQPPASVAKVATALYALDRLGGAHRFATEVLATGPVEGGIVRGDLILAGSGDPALTADGLAGLAAGLAAAGVRGVAGRFLTWDAALPFVERIAADQPDFVGYNPAVGGLNLNFNRVHFEWAREGAGWRTALDARSDRVVPPVTGIRMAVVPREAPLFTHAAGPATEDWTVAAARLGTGGRRWLPVRRPGAHAGEVFRWLAAAQGVALPAPGPGRRREGPVLARHEGEPLARILRDMLRYSTNATAEAVGLAASARAGAAPGADPLAVSAGAMSDWIGATRGLAARFGNHSGLGTGSRVSAADMVRLLVAVRDGPLPGLMRDAGLKDRGGAPVGAGAVRVPAKTGTLNFVSALAGYIRPPGGREMAFAIFAADRARRDALAMEDREDPPGGKAWLKRSRALQGGLVARWAALYA